MNRSNGEHPVAVVTGSSSGIGAATARRLAADGFDVVVHAASNRAAAEEVADDLGKVAGCQARISMCDFSESGCLPGFVQDCFAWQGRVDVWVNNAGADVLTGETVGWSFVQKLNRLMQVDVVATLILSREAGSRMQHQVPLADSRTSGLIVNLGWDQAGQGMGGDSGQLFSASKGAVMAISRSLAQTLAPAVRVNCVAPGWIQTAWGQSASAAWQIRATQESLLGRWGQPQDVAGVISFLAGPDGQFVNGQVIPVNGGFRFNPGFAR